jgi:hypothetical protein
VVTLETSQVGSKIASSATSAPPGLAVEAGGATPKAAQSPRFAPSAPSPAALPKPDEVKRGTPTRAQNQFATQSTTQTQTSKIGSVPGYGAEFSKTSANLYQASYSQYQMDLGRPVAGATAQGTQTSGTPKSAGRSAVPTVAAQSPARAQAQSAQIQQQQAQQVQQQVQQQQPQTQPQTQQAPQTQAKQGQTQQTQQQGQANQQQAAQLHQAHAAMPGYHHYAPPPPPGMAMPYNPYNYAGYYQGYGYYQNPQVRFDRYDAV